jgi:two-component system response regulator NreC
MPGSFWFRLLIMGTKMVFNSIAARLLLPYQKNRCMSISRKKLNFSGREMQILKLVKEGLTSQEIGKILELAEDTVEGHRRNMIKKTGAKNMIVVVYSAQKRGLI